MSRKALALIVAAAACLGASPLSAADKPATRAAKPAAARAVDIRDPASLVAVLSELAAEATIARRDGDAVFLAVTSATETFSAQYAGCDAQGRGCQAVLFDRQGGEGSPTLAQLNAFNQTSMMCRLYQDRSGRPHVQYSALLFPKEGRAELVMHLNAWRGCSGDFNAFLKDPAGFLAGAA
jgi:hypothetical protein